MSTKTKSKKAAKPAAKKSNGARSALALVGQHQPVIAIPGVTLERRSLSLKPGCTIQQAMEAGRFLGQMTDLNAWYLGDLINGSESVHGEKYTQVVAATGLEEKTLQNMVWVAGKIESSVRTELSFGHHVRVAALDKAEQIRWLKLAMLHQLSVSELRASIKAGEVVRDADKAPSDRQSGILTIVSWCSDAERWIKEKGQNGLFLKWGPNEWSDAQRNLKPIADFIRQYPERLGFPELAEAPEEIKDPDFTVSETEAAATEGEA